MIRIQIKPVPPDKKCLQIDKIMLIDCPHCGTILKGYFYIPKVCTLCKSPLPPLKHLIEEHDRPPNWLNFKPTTIRYHTEKELFQQC